MLRTLPVLTTVVLLVLLDLGYGHDHTSKVFKCPCSFSVSRQVVPKANNEAFDILVEPFASSARNLQSRNSNVIEERSSRNLQVGDAIHSDSEHHFFRKMNIVDQGLFRVRIRHHNTEEVHTSPNYNLELHSSARQIVCPVVFEPDRPLERTIDMSSFNPEQLRQDMRMGGNQDPRIVGGLLASPTLLPYLVAIQIPTRCSDGTTGCVSFCTGTLLSGKWIMTAAHCGVVPGSRILILSRSSRRVELYTPAVTVFNHPLYATTTGSRRNFFDIAVVELGVNVEGCCGVAPPQFMPINFNNAVPRDGAFARAAGYGVISEDNSIADPDVGALRQVDVPIVSNAACSAVYGLISSTMQTCAGYRRDGGCDTCFGDSGGPLVQYDGDTPVLLGVTSFGAGCARVNRPGVYTRPSGHKEWLESTPAIYTEHGGAVNQKILRCRKGQFLPYTEGETSVCTACPDNESSPGGTIRECDPCRENLLRDTRRGNKCSCRALEGYGLRRGKCELCRPRFASAFGVARCRKCPANTFAAEAGSTECLPCPGARRGSRTCDVGAA